MAAIDDLKRVVVERVFVTREQAGSIVSPDGGEDTWIFDFKNALLDGDSLDLICELVFERMRLELPFQVGGLETAAIAMVAGLVMKAKEKGVSLSGFYTRKSKKKFGLQRDLEGRLTSDPVVILDDVMNSGKSVEKQVVALEKLGVRVHAVCVLVRYRELSYYDYFAKKGIKLISIFSLADLEGILGRKFNGLRENAPPPRQSFTDVWKFLSPNPNLFHVVPKSGPVIDDTAVYMGADCGSMYAINQANGRVIWEFQTKFGANRKRIFSTPAIHGNALYFGAYDGNLYALDKSDGSLRWVFDECDWIGSSPCVAPELGSVFVGLEYGLPGRRGAVASVDMETGEKKWSTDCGDGQVHASPGYRNGVVVCGSNSGYAAGYDAVTGVEVWRCQTGGDVKAGVAFDEAGDRVVFGSMDGRIWVVSASTGEALHVVRALGGIYSTPATRTNLTYVCSLDKGIYCVDMDTGKVKWVYWTSGRAFSTPVIADDRLYAGSNDGRLYELDPATGREMGFYQASERIVNGISYNEKTKRYFLPTHAGELYCLRRGAPSKVVRREPMVLGEVPDRREIAEEVTCLQESQRTT